MHGCPERIITDRGPNFTSILFKALCRMLGTECITTTPYHPQANGQCERLHGPLVSHFKTFCRENQVEWDKLLPAFSFAYRSSNISGTEFSPFFLLYGRDPIFPSDLEYGTCNSNHTVEECLLKMAVAQRHWRVEQRKRARKMKTQYDKTHKKVSYRIGEKVILHQPLSGVGTSKLTKLWSEPMKIIKKISDENYVIKSQGGRYESTIHVSRLKKIPGQEPGKK